MFGTANAIEPVEIARTKSAVRAEEEEPPIREATRANTIAAAKRRDAEAQSPAEARSPEDCSRSLIAGALDEAYCVLLPHEAARRAELRRCFWAASCDEGRKRDFIDRCLGRRD